MARRRVQASPVPPPVFVLDFEAGDKMMTVTGARRSLAAWTRHVMLSQHQLTVMMEEARSPWIDPVIQLKRQRPDVQVSLLTEETGLAEVVQELGEVQVKVYFRADPAMGTGVSGRFGGIVAVRDQTAVFLAPGEPSVAEGDFGKNGTDEYLFCSIVESGPLAKAYEALVLNKGQAVAQLPRDLRFLGIESGASAAPAHPSAPKSAPPSP